MVDVLSNITLFGNNIVQYLLFIGILLVAYFGTRIVYYLFEKVFSVLASKTTSKLDDLIVDSLRRPVTYAVVLAGIWYGRLVLTLSESALNTYSIIVSTLLVLVITFFVIRIADSLLAHYLDPLAKSSSSAIDDTAFQVFRRLLNVVIYIIAIVIILQNFGYKVTGLVAGLGIGGLAFALAAQDILGNMFGGGAVLVDKPFKVGDRIKVAGQDGFVKKISLRSTTIETFGRTHIVMPNKSVVDSVLENVSREDMRRDKVVVGLEYATSAKDLKKAKELLKRIIANNDNTAEECMVHFINFGPSSLDLQLIYWISNMDDILGVMDEVRMAIKTEFDKAGYSFAFPTQTIHLNK